jgi:hypothetical protein
MINVLDKIADFELETAERFYGDETPVISTPAQPLVAEWVAVVGVVGVILAGGAILALTAAGWFAGAYSWTALLHNLL